MLGTIRGRRKVVNVSVGWLALGPTRYERAQTRGCFDLRYIGPNSEVRIIKPPNKEVSNGQI